MSREIRFRAWDDFQKEMLYGDDFILDFCGQPHEGCVIGLVEYEKDERLHRREVRLLQYIDIKDKNAKEIWEGDIIKPGNLKPREVKMTFTPSGGWKADYGYSYDHNFPAPHWVEVIGNIYENPELLK